MPSQPRELALLDRAAQMLSQATTVDDLKEVRDAAESARVYAKAARLGLDLHNRAAEIKLRAERQAGLFLGQLHLAGGDRRSKRHGASLKLETLGITKDQSKRWQRAATVPEAEFERYIQSANTLGKELTAAGLLRIAGARRPASRSRTRKPSSVNLEKAEFLALLDEVNQHSELLSSILEPMLKGQSVKLQTVERRCIVRLVKDIRQSISELRKQVWRDG